MNKAFTNSLIKESSPYLLQHAHNPVNWYAWGADALQLAKEKDIPILLSIGYAACHWCHVMERESFEDEGVAAYMNEHFINIKVDREERPDLDHIYMEAVQAISGSGGWPLNVFLTPDTKPFFGGTYFPPHKVSNRASWKEILSFITSAWATRRTELLEQADTLINHINTSGHALLQALKLLPKDDNLFSLDDCHLIAKNMLLKADKNFGGFGKAPKFPQTFTLQYLLFYGHQFKNDEALQHALFSLKQMVNGGIYDHLAGGMARYSTDDEWLAPHFEKMLYDNALLVITLSEAFQVSGDDFYKKAIDKTLAFLMRDMQHKDGGFYAALDADTEGEEGKFYVWQKAEIEKVVTEPEIYCKWYGVTESGNWEGKNILQVKNEANIFETENNITKKNLQDILQQGDEILLAQRSKRVYPAVDDKIILGWNALLITAFCKAYAATLNEEYKKEAIQLHAFILKVFKGTNGSFFHNYKNNIAKNPAFLDDYAYLAQASIYLQEITFNPEYLYVAKGICDYVIKNFADTESGLFFFTGLEQDDVVLRKTEVYDGAVPSGNSIMAENLYYLSVIFDEVAWRETALHTLYRLKDVCLNYPTSFACWCSFLLKQAVGYTELVVTGTSLQEAQRELLQLYLPAKIMQGHSTFLNMPMLKSKEFNENLYIYRCKDYQCEAPVSSVTSLNKTNI
ncbi:MAG: thioredoxin domain-containing protein [Ferruginibacter sp.]